MLVLSHFWMEKRVIHYMFPRPVENDSHLCRSARSTPLCLGPVMIYYAVCVSILAHKWTCNAAWGCCGTCLVPISNHIAWPLPRNMDFLCRCVRLAIWQVIGWTAQSMAQKGSYESREAFTSHQEDVWEACSRTQRYTRNKKPALNVYNSGQEFNLPCSQV